MCDHRWRKVYEQGIIGITIPSGWECVDCKEYVSMDKLTPAGLPGIILEKSARLVGINGGCGNCSDGSVYKEQIVDEDGELTIVRP